jgi:hypothetical protein
MTYIPSASMGTLRIQSVSRSQVLHLTPIQLHFLRPWRSHSAYLAGATLMRVAGAGQERWGEAVG